MRPRNAVLSLTALICSATIHGQQQPVQTFRSGRELLTIDTSVRDAAGKPVTDLQASDFTVRIDGQPRPVLTVQVFGVNEISVGNQSELLPRFARAREKPAGRVVVFAIDRDSMRPGSERAALETISRVIDKLPPADAAGAVELPGRSIELTRDHTIVANAVKTMTGTAPRPDWQHYMSWDEALAYERSDKATIAQVVSRECPNVRTLAGIDPCPDELRTQAGSMLQLGRLHADAVLSALTSVLNALVPLRAPKRVVLVSAGLPYDQQLLTRFDDLVEKAAQAHVAISVLHLDQPGFDASSRAIEVSVAGGRDYATGLANIASATGGEFFMGVGGAQGALDRIAASIEVFYQLGVESQPSDADGKTHRVEVRLARAGLKAQAPARTAIVPPSRQSGDAIRRALSQPTDLADVPLEVAPYVTHSTDRAKVRLVIAAQIGSDIVPTEWGYVVVKDGKELPGEQIHVAAGEHAPWTATAAVDLDPGRYRVRTAVAIADGRVAVLEVPVVATLRSAEPLSTGDLMIGTVEDGKLQPRAKVRQDERAVGMIELSSSEPLGDTTGTLLITRGGTTQPALRVPLSLRTRADDKSVVIAESPVDLSSLGAGPYTASAVLTRGGKPVAQVNRVFEIAPGASRASPSPAGPAASMPVRPRDPALDEMMILVGRYVTDYAQETSLIVGVEHYDQRRLNAAQAQIQRRVTVAEFALVRTSDAIGWSGFRDVTEVDGKRIANHGARLQALFHGGSGDLAEARRIADESARYNIGATTRNFNEPTSVLFFFTPQTQARFALTRRGDQTIDGRTVWAIDFKETASPTLIRTSNGHDVPAQGTIWVNPSDGAVVRTRLLLTGFAGIGSKTDIDVSYALDSHLQMWLPAAMHERDDLELTSEANSGGMFGGFSARQRTSVVGTATYTDFKRFQTSGAVKIKK